MRGEQPSRNLGRPKTIGERVRRSEAWARQFKIDSRYLDHLARRHSKRTGLPLAIANRIVAAVAVSAKARFRGGPRARLLVPRPTSANNYRQEKTPGSPATSRATTAFQRWDCE
jgi:hypothetical protein